MSTQPRQTASLAPRPDARRWPDQAPVVYRAWRGPEAATGPMPPSRALRQGAWTGQLPDPRSSAFARAATAAVSLARGEARLTLLTRARELATTYGDALHLALLAARLGEVPLALLALQDASARATTVDEARQVTEWAQRTGLAAHAHRALLQAVDA